VAFKIGRSEAGAKAAVSHTGALAGADRMYDALFKQVGVIRAQTFADLLDIPAALATGRKLRGNRVAILTSTGGAGTLVSDDLGMAGFDTPAPDAATAEALRALQTGDHAVLDRNPIDVTLAGLKPELLRGAINVLLQSPTYDALTIIVGSSSLAMPELMAGAIQDCLPNSDKPIIAYVSPHAPEVGALLTERGVPAFAAAESCTAALRAMLNAGRFQAPAEAASKAPTWWSMTCLPVRSTKRRPSSCSRASACLAHPSGSSPRRRRPRQRRASSVVASCSRSSRPRSRTRPKSAGWPST
jgi:acyl-CoA synthetase (NDP forming)